MLLRIKEIAKTNGVKITELANIVGITQPNLSNIVNGKTSPSLYLLQRIADALGVEVAELFAPSRNVVRCPHCGAVLEVLEKDKYF